MDFTEPTPADPDADPVAVRGVTASWILGGVAGLVLGLGVFGAWNPAGFVYVDRWLNPYLCAAALVPLACYIGYLRTDGDNLPWALRRFALFSLLPLAAACLAIQAFSSDQHPVAVSRSGEYEVVEVEFLADRTFVLRTRDGVLSREAAVPLLCPGLQEGVEARFDGERAVEFEASYESAGTVRVTFDGLTVHAVPCG